MKTLRLKIYNLYSTANSFLCRLKFNLKLRTSFYNTLWVIFYKFKLMNFNDYLRYQITPDEDVVDGFLSEVEGRKFLPVAKKGVIKGISRTISETFRKVFDE